MSLQTGTHFDRPSIALAPTGLSKTNGYSMSRTIRAAALSRTLSRWMLLHLLTPEGNADSHYESQASAFSTAPINSTFLSSICLIFGGRHQRWTPSSCQLLIAQRCRSPYCRGWWRPTGMPIPSTSSCANRLTHMPSRPKYSEAVIWGNSLCFSIQESLPKALFFGKVRDDKMRQNNELVLDTYLASAIIFGNVFTE